MRFFRRAGRWLAASLLLCGWLAAGEVGQFFHNPILRGYHADPTICRVGDDYYLATSSSEYFPGLPIYHSRDLVNWRLAGHALHRWGQIDLTGVENSKGMFAPTLRYHGGKFYLVTTVVGAPMRSGNVLLTAERPEGPWSDPIWLEDAPGIDPSLFFDDDGRVYYCGNRRPEKMIDPSHRLVWIQEIDLLRGRMAGPRTEFDPEPLYASQAIGPVGWLEAPHLYKRDGWYHLVLSHGGTWLDHAVSSWRSRSPLGPWEMNPANPLLTHRGERPPGITSTGHADLVETATGQWWAVVLGIRGETGKSVMGRETFLVPVDWSHDWPAFNPHRQPGRLEAVSPAPKLPATGIEFTASTAGLCREGELAAGWMFLRAPSDRWWRCAGPEGRLELRARPDELTAAVGEPSALLRRVTEEQASVGVVVDFTPDQSGSRAGLVVLRARDAVWSLAVERQGGLRVVSAYRGNIRLQSIPLGERKPAHLRIDLRARRLEFFAGEAGRDLVRIADDQAELLAASTAGRFTGSMAGVFATAPEPETAAFECFELRTTEPK